MRLYRRFLFFFFLSVYFSLPVEWDGVCAMQSKAMLVVNTLMLPVIIKPPIPVLLRKIVRNGAYWPINKAIVTVASIIH